MTLWWRKELAVVEIVMSDIRGALAALGTLGAMNEFAILKFFNTPQLKIALIIFGSLGASLDALLKEKKGMIPGRIHGQHSFFGEPGKQYPDGCHVLV